MNTEQEIQDLNNRIDDVETDLAARLTRIENVLYDLAISMKKEGI